MFMPGPFELIILLPFVILIFWLISRAFGGRKDDSQRRGFSFGHTTLTCPHCSKETPAGIPTCKHCGEEL